MIMPPETNYKTDKNCGHEGFAAWKRDVHQSFRSSDLQLLDLMPNPIMNMPAAQWNWHRTEAEAEAMIDLNLGPVANVRRKEFILESNADERNAPELCQLLHNEYTATNSQTIQN